MVRTIVEMDHGLVLVMAIVDGSSLAVLAAPSCDVGLVAHETVEPVLPAADLVYCAADLVYCTVPEVTDEAMDTVPRSKVIAPFFLAQQAATRMPPTDGISFVSGVAAERPPLSSRS